jgi:hypothetical protein
MVIHCWFDIISYIPEQRATELEIETDRHISLSLTERAISDIAAITGLIMCILTCRTR